MSEIVFPTVTLASVIMLALKPLIFDDIANSLILLRRSVLRTRDAQDRKQSLRNIFHIDKLSKSLLTFVATTCSGRHFRHA